MHLYDVTVSDTVDQSIPGLEEETENIPLSKTHDEGDSEVNGVTVYPVIQMLIMYQGCRRDRTTRHVRSLG